MSMLLFCLGFFLPVVGSVLSAVSPAPLVLLGVRENKAWMTLGILSAALTLLLVLDLILTLFFLLCCGLLCCGLTLPLGKLEKGSESLLLCIAVSIISKVLFIGACVALAGQNPFAIDANALYAMFDGIYPQETLAQVAELLPYMMPLSVIMYSVFESFLNYKLCEIIQRKREGEAQFPPLPPFGEWRFPSSLIYALVFVFVVPMISDGGGRLWTMIEYNLKFLISAFFFMQGLALVWWWLSKYSANHHLPLMARVVLTGFIALPFTWIAALGFGDMCFDFRTKKIKRA